ncbi:MAG: FecR domain-containing protein [Gammaproteobacteria bacterium]
MNNPANPPPESPNRDASMWLSRLERGLREDEGTALREWLKTPANAHAIMESARLLHVPDAIFLLSQLVPPVAEPPRPKPGQRALLVSMTAVALVSTVLFCIMLLSGETASAYFNRWLEKPDTGGTRTYATGVGEKQEVKLADGSTITLNTGTRLSITYTPRSRDVYLAYGEASFNVANGNALPLHVSAGQRQFQAAGSRFNLRALTPQTVELTVIAGQLKLLYAPPHMPESPAQRREEVTYGETTLCALETATVEPGFQSVSNIQASELEARLAWQQGLLVFDQRALEDVIAEVERYTTTRFVLADQALRNVRISGRFPAGNVNSVRHALYEKFLIGSGKDAQGRVVLRARPAL